MAEQFVGVFVDAPLLSSTVPSDLNEFVSSLYEHMAQVS